MKNVRDRLEALLASRFSNLLIFLYFSADICDDSGVTPAHVAAQRGHIDCLYTLVEHKVDVLQGDNDDLTPTDWAAKADQHLCHQYLTMVTTCWTAKEELEQTQEKLER